MYINTSANMSNAGNDICRGWNVFQGNEAYPSGLTLGGNSKHNNLAPYTSIYMYKRIS